MNLLEQHILNKFKGRSLLILGFGREGQSTYQLLRRLFPEKRLTIADRNEAIQASLPVQGDERLEFITGPGYLEQTGRFDYILRSPGIPVWDRVINQTQDGRVTGGAGGAGKFSRECITSQTELFLECFARQTTGITGTKGKSTTSSLIHHIVKTSGTDALLMGNIGNPVFHFAGLITPSTHIVCELSSHQLEFLTKAPRTAVFLNLFQEHLDAYENFDAYQLAKANITKYQEPGDNLIFHAEDPLVSRRVEPYLPVRHSFPFSLTARQSPGAYIADGQAWFSNDGKTTPVWKVHQDRFLRGDHNLKNILAALSATMIQGIPPEDIADGIATFKGLAHRLEYVGVYRGIHFYNDSIATIPEACIEAVKSLPDVDTLVAGGFDRQVDYSALASFLNESGLQNIILTGDAGRRIAASMTGLPQRGKRIFTIDRFDDFQEIAFRVTRPGHACLLSPAAASYDEFMNFEERGCRFRELVSGRRELDPDKG